jgi:hypothetical protein
MPSRVHRMVQIRKLTVLPKSTIFPMLHQTSVDNIDDDTLLAELEV